PPLGRPTRWSSGSQAEGRHRPDVPTARPGPGPTTARTRSTGARVSQGASMTTYPGSSRTSSLLAGAAPLDGLPDTTRKTYVLDTSVLLSDPWAMLRFAEHQVVLPVVV